VGGWTPVGSELGRPPARRCRPQASPLLSLCNTEIVSVQHRNSVCLTQKHNVSCQRCAKNKMSGDGSPWRRFEVCGYGGASYGPPGAIGTVPGPKNGQKIKCCPPPPCWGSALEGVLHWSLYNTKIWLCATQKLYLCNTEIASVQQRAHWFLAKISQKSKIGRNGSPCHRFEHSGRGN